MKLVIDIPDNVFKRTVFYREFGDLNDCIATIKALEKAAPLPKGHGRLIDEKEATNLIAEGKNGDKAYFGTVDKDWEVIDFLKTLSTIIEADKENEE